MKFLEKDLEDILWENLQTDEGTDILCDRGLATQTPYKSYRQFRIGNYGIADLITYDRAKYFKTGKYTGMIAEIPRVTIYELKKEELTANSFLQASRYAIGILRYLEYRKKDYDPITIDIILIGKGVDKNSRDLKYLQPLTNDLYTLHVYVYNYRYGMDGISFELQESFKLKDEGFK